MPQYNEHARPATRTFSKLSILAFLISLPSLCLFVFAFVSLPLGIVGITRTGSSSQKRGQGLAVAATVISAVGILLSCIQVGILLPAFGAARQAAWRLKDRPQFEYVLLDLRTYAANNNGNLPDANEDWKDLLIQSGTPSEAFISNAYGGDPDFIYYVPHPVLTDEPDRVLLYTRPDLYARGEGYIGYHDGHVQPCSALELQTIVDSLSLPDGTPYAPHLDD